MAEHEQGLTREELSAAAQVRFVGLPVRRIAELVERAVAAGALVESQGRLQLPSVESEEATDRLSLVNLDRPMRAVAVDLESVVRTTATEPYTDKRIFQIGAVRIGTDAAWIGQSPSFDCFVALPNSEWEIHSEKVRSRHEAEAIAPVQALLALQAFCDGTDAIVTYNGTEADFPLLAAAYEREELPMLDAAFVDAYYLTLAIWPTASSHRLAELADALGVDRAGLGWHDAVDDAELLARVLAHAALEFVRWPTGLRDLVVSACADSAGWTLLRHLATVQQGAFSEVGQVREHGHAEVASVLGAQLSVHTPRRPPVGPPAGRRALRVGAGLRGADGRVDPVLLAAVAHGTAATRRPAQEQMTTALHSWVDAGLPALVEAPTGTGKSFAVLAAALDWLAAGPQRTAIIATFTKQLQAQLATDVVKLDQVVPGLVEASDVVKGQANRLSLRALTVVLADATTAPLARTRPGNRNRFLASTVFRELTVFLMLRMFAATGVRDSWAAHSVDPVDVPAFFSGYAGARLPVWLESLSQAVNGEYPADAPTPVAAHTDVVREALDSHSLLLTNHALLLAHLDDLGTLGGDTLLIVDEAHQLEDAATSALTTAVDYRTIEDLLAELSAWLETARAGTERDAVREAADNLGILLDHEQLPRVASQAFDARGTAVGTAIGSRTVTLASAYAGSSGISQVRTLSGLLLRLAGQCEALVGSLAAYLAAHQGTGMDFFDAERVRALLARCADIKECSRTVVADIDAILGSQAAVAAAGLPGSQGPTGMDEVADAGAAPGDLFAGDHVDDSLADEPNEQDDTPDEPGSYETPSQDQLYDTDDSTLTLGELAPGTSNQVVYAEELEPLRASLRSYRFRIATSPVELGADATWQRFLAAFARTYYVSATLRVAGRWDFIRSRLGLPGGIATLDLPTPFDLASQAELVCLSDFPSWAEQSEGAMRTVAHQLAGYAREVIRPVPVFEEPAPGTRGGYDGGALVLTTARSTAGGIADHLATEFRHRGDQTPVLSALVLGNPRGVRQFTDREYGGGILVGTKGLWQGVDVADADRLSLVWINKLPFAPFAAPIIEARRAAVTARAETVHAEDPEAVATQAYYLPLAALQLRQAVGRLIRSERHRGVVVISDRKLAGATALRRAYRTTFLGSLEDGLLVADPVTGERAGGNVVPMADGWERIWRFLARHGLLTAERAAELSTPEALEEHTLLPQTRRIRSLEMSPEQVAEHRVAGTLEAEVLQRAAVIGGLLNLSDEPTRLKDSQREVITAVAQGRNVLGLLPTGFGKSFCFQLPALVLPGVTLVVSPLVALMHDQALELNRSIGGAVRALVAPLRESSSRAGKTEVADQLLGRHDHRIRLVYVSPERLCQRRFREVVRQAVADGTVTRIALDEAHTFVQWDDFRPSMSRVEQFLAELRRDFSLPVTALTATANRTVHAGLREGVFGLPAQAPGGAAVGEAVEAAAGTLLTVRENPIRPELAIFRRSINAAGPAITAGLAEEVLDTVVDHAIFYCLTVKEVVALHAHLRDYLGESGVRVRRFHGRLTEAEKSAVMTEFREAPRRGEEGFAPLVVVATSAFGLGINRPDVRTVFCVSAPTDLASLYQQIGRCGRDAAGKAIVGADTADTADTAGLAKEHLPGAAATAVQEPTHGVLRDTPGAPQKADAPASAPAEGGAKQLDQHPENVGLALLTSRGLRTVNFMTAGDLSPALLARMGRAVLASDGVLDPVDVADQLIGQDLDAGRLSVDDARKSRTSDAYVAGVVRAFAALASLGALEDLGDFPPYCAVKPGELLGLTAPVGSADATSPDGSSTPFPDVVAGAVLSLPVRSLRPGTLRRNRLDVARLDAHLAGAVPGFRTLAQDPAGTWQLLADMHDQGLLDVSAAPSRRLVTGLRVRTPSLPSGFMEALSGKAARAAEEIRLLREFFTDSTVCANQKFADYFGVADLPQGCCSTAANRCSACWDAPTWSAGQVKPKAAVALETPRPRPAGARTDAVHRQRRLDEQVYRLVWEVFAGVYTRDLYRALRGEETYFQPRTRRRVRLRTGLVNSRFFGANPAVRLGDIDDALGRLEALGKVVAQGPRWREAGHVRREDVRAARAAGANGTGIATPGQCATP
ncbi:DEAD/DEAH box helicase [Streptacidiphilus sp. MAP5-3]|uniref:DEAD/DEAH box helicase n=1 Tax=unclassified Streptacidiphilus TaxID=2643834 RepID=UPI00351817D9